MACTDTKAQFQFECCTAFEGAGKGLHDAKNRSWRVGERTPFTRRV
jgi:hypothetical protein